MRAIIIIVLTGLWMTVVTPVQGQTPIAADSTMQSDQSLPQLFELPWNIRRDLPELKLTVRNVSDNPEERFAKINGERFEEGDSIEGVDIIAIRDDGVVCEFNGYQFIIN